MTDEPQTLTDLLPATPDLRAERLAELKRLFPDLFHLFLFIDDGRRSAIVCLDWNRPLADSTLKRLGELAATASSTETTREKAGEKPFFLCLERSLSTTTKWNLAQILGDHFTAY